MLALARRASASSDPYVADYGRCVAAQILAQRASEGSDASWLEALQLWREAAAGVDVFTRATAAMHLAVDTYDAGHGAEAEAWARRALVSPDFEVFAKAAVMLAGAKADIDPTSSQLLFDRYSDVAQEADPDFRAHVSEIRRIIADALIVHQNSDTPSGDRT